MNPPVRPESLRFHPGAGAVVAFGPFRFDRANRLLSRGDEEIALPPRVLAVLEFLIDRAGRVVPKEVLIAEVWEGSHVTDTSPAEAISVLRQALGDEAQSPRYIQTVHRRGYRFVAALTPVGPAPGEAVLTAVEVESGETPEAPRAAGQPAVGRVLGLVLALVVGVAAGALLKPTPHPIRPPRAVEFAVPLPEGDTLLHHRPSLAFSPDGRTLALTLHSEDGTSLAVRRMDGVELRELPGTEGAAGPFFSPDGRWLAFFVDGLLKRVPVGGGQPVTIAPAPKGLGGVWAPDDTIYFGRWSTGRLWRVPANGGEATPVTRPDPGSGELAHVWPALLPDGKGMLYTILSTAIDEVKIAVQGSEGGPGRILLENAGQAAFVPPDRLVFVTAGGLRVAGFDPDRLELTSAPEPLSYPVSINPTLVLGIYAVSPTGALAFRPGNVPVGARRLAFLNAAGEAEHLPLPERFYRNLAWDPVHERFAATILEGERSDVWVGGDGALQRLTFEGFNIEPQWTPDGRRLTFASSRSGPYAILERPADGSEPARVVLAGEEHLHPDDWSPNGERLLYGRTGSQTGLDLWMAERSADGWIESPFQVTESDEIYGSFSPDGRWIAYLSNASGQYEIFVRPSAGGGGPWQASFAGAYEPQWSAEGDEIYFLQDRWVVAVPFTAEPEVRLGEPVRLFEAPEVAILRAAGRRRFLAILEAKPQPGHREEVRVVLDAFAPGP